VIPAAQAVGGTGQVIAVDVQEAKLIATSSAARHAGLKNVTVLKADLSKPTPEPASNSCDAVIVASVIHELTDRTALWHTAYRLLKTGGQLLAVDWKKQASVVGPHVSRRVDQTVVEHELTNLGFHKVVDVPADSFHYGLIYKK
jgi:ubiquinone/menaquinone biosynthesis C-methylase UbiE